MLARATSTVVLNHVLRNASSLCLSNRLSNIATSSSNDEELASKTYVDMSGLLPHHDKLRDGTEVSLQRLLLKSDVDAVHILMNNVIKEGTSLTEEVALTREEFRRYFLTHDPFVLKTINNGEKKQELVGAFLVKPNRPGRGSHIWNGTLLIEPKYRCQGAAFMIGKMLYPIAKRLGYKAAVFNMVFETNQASLKIWDRLGYKRIGTLPKAGRLNGYNGYVDAAILYQEIQ